MLHSKDLEMMSREEMKEFNRENVWYAVLQRKNKFSAQKIITFEAEIS